MQEGKEYILHNLKTLLNLDQIPYELSNGSVLDKFISSQDQDSLIIGYPPTKEFKVIQRGSKLPEEGHIVYISKIRSGSSLKNYFSISVKPALQFKYLSQYLKTVHEHVVTRTNDPSLFAIKQLKAVLTNNLKTKLINEADLNFTTLEEQFDFWQEQDLEKSSQRCSYFLKEYASIAKSWKNLENLDLSRLGNLIEATWVVLYHIWNSGHDYNEKRFTKIVEIFQMEIKNKIKLAFSRQSDLLDMSFEIKQKIIESLGYCKKFIQLSQYYSKCSKRKMPHLKLKTIQQLQMKIMATFRTKSKVQILNRLYKQKIISQDPSSLIFLVRSENFMSNYMTLFKNNPKAQQKLQNQKQKLQSFCKMIRPHIQTSIQQGLQKQNIQYLLKALEKWFFFLNDSEIAENTPQIQGQSLKAIINYLDRFWAGGVKKIGQQNLSTQKLRNLLTYKHKISQIDTLMTEFAANSMEYPKYKQKISQMLTQCQKDQNKFIKQFKDKFNNGIIDKNQSIKLLGRYIETLQYSDTQGIIFQVSHENQLFIRQTKKMLEMNFAYELSEEYIRGYQEAKKYHKENSFIKNLKSRYNTIQGKLQHFQKIIVEKQLNEIKAIVASPPIRKKISQRSYQWKDLDQVENFINKFNNTFDKLIDYLKLFNQSQAQIQEIAMDIMNIEFATHNFFVISQKLEQVNKIMENVSSNRDTAEWREYWKIKLTQVVGLIWKQALLKGVTISMTINSTFISGISRYQPDLCEVKQKYLRQVKSFIGWPCQSKHIDGTCILENQGKLLIQIYQKIQRTFREIQQNLEKYSNIEKVLDIDVDMLEQKINSEQISSEDLSDVLQKTKEVKDQIEAISDEQKVGSLIIDNTSLKSNMNDVADEKSESIIQLIKYSIKIESEQVEDYITNAMKKLDSKPNNMNEMAGALKQYEQIMDSEKQIQKKIKQIEARNANIRSITGASFNTVNMMKRWQNFQITSIEMGRILGQQKSRLQQDSIKRSEVLEHQVQKLYKKYQQIKPKTQNLDRQQILEVYGKIKDWYGQWQQAEVKAKTIKSDIKQFNMRMPEFTVYQNIKAKLQKQLGNWLLFIQFRNQIQIMQKQEWITFRGTLYKYADLINQYMEKLKHITHNDSTSKFFNDLLHQNLESLGLLRNLTGQNFEKQHWGMLFSILKIKNVTSADKLLFLDLLESDLLGKANEIRDLQSRAKGQLTIKDALGELQAWGLTRQFELTQYNSMGRVTPLIKQWKDVMTQVSDHQAMVSSVRQSKYATRFKGQIERYQQNFGILDDALLKLNQIQRKWIYLEPIFMRGALPSEQGRWKRLDEEYRNITNNISNNPIVISLASIPGFQETLSNIIIQLQKCQKALNDFLEEKRNKFPRFYFLGDDDMLEILGQSQNPTIIQMHLKKLFSGIHKVKFGQNNESLLAMLSSLGEEVKLLKTIQVTDVVQNWLEQLNINMVSTLKKLLNQIDSKDDSRFDNHSSQIICLINQIDFNKDCANHINRNSLKEMKQNYQQILSSLTKKSHSISNSLTLSKIKSLILDLIHQISVVDLLIRKKVQTLNNWHWFKQLKFDKKNNDVAISMADAEFVYTFQYQGNAQKLVYTPLTDKCYLTLTQAMKMGLGGNPYGPAGTGKTQSVKALALAFGRQVLVFNCDEGLDFHSMGRIFIGLVKCGAWGCFDEFNRLLQEQLSAISQQIQIIQEAIKAREKTINLLGKQVDVNFNSGIFVTLNPAGKGYGGRSKLPDNLKQLFRPIAMSVPDNELIAEVLLFAEGFTVAKELASKIITIFTLSKQLLSRQLHYDWGLRALKTILTVAGRLIFEEKENLDSKKQSQILIKALRINTISKLTFNDMLKFNILVQDVFPGIDIKDIIYEKISQAVEQIFKQQKFDLLPSQMNKILQFYQATKQRIGAVLVGPSGCGKTTIWKTLKKAYEILQQPVKIHLINPKAMSRSKFLGYMNNDTREFSEGVLTASAREVIKQDQETLSWIICDGDVDPEWIQALNSVLDDNHLLTLPTGQRISFGSNVNFIFETDNLQFASPATVSRMGMIFMNEEDININGIISKWMTDLPPQRKFITEHTSTIQQACEKIYEINQKQIVSTTKVGLVRNALSLLHSSNDEQQFKLNLVKGLASNFGEQDRGQIFQAIYGKAVPGNRDPLSLIIQNGKISSYKDIDTQEVKKIYHTKSLLKDIDVIQGWLYSNQNVIIVGKEGCGKSILLEASIQELEKHEKCRLVTIHCNRQTKSQQLIQKLFQTCQKVTSATGKMLKPLNCAKQIFLLKEVNLAKPDKYNTIQLITFIQSLITHEGFYDQNLEFIRIAEGIQFVCIMKPSSTIGRFQLTTRFVSNLRVLQVDYDSVGTKQKLSELTPHSQKIDEKLQSFWHIVTDNFKSDDNAHYLFTPRNLNGIVNHLESYKIDFSKESQVCSAIYYQVNKQFGDRLVDAKSKDKFKKLITPLFGDHQNLCFYSDNGKLCPSSRPEYIEMLQSAIKVYHNQVKQTNIFLVDEVINLMGSIEKKIIDGGHLLLAGSSGSLRKTAVRILANKHKITLSTLSNLRNPSLKQFYKDLRSIMEIAGGQNKPVIIYLEQQQLGKSVFYEKINSLISSGQIPGLFNPDEIEGITQDPEQLRSEFYGNTLYECFIERIKKNVIIVLSFDHRNKQFYEICSSNPAFYSFCRIIWLNCYSTKSLKEICIQKIKSINIKQKDQIIEGFIKLHEGSSLKYMNLIDNFVGIYHKLESKHGNRLDKLKMGLKKLKETAKVVDQLTANAVKTEKLLTKKEKQASLSLDLITEAIQQASASKAQKQKLQQFLSVEEKKIQKDRHQVMVQLDKVQPLIEEAKTAVSGLSKKNIQNIRAFMNPPEAVRHVLKAVLTIFGNKDESWNSMKNFLKICKEKILYFEIKDIRENVRRQVESIIETHAYSFQRENIYKASQQAVPLAEWVKAVIQYSRTYQRIRPLEQNLNKIEKQLSVSKKRQVQCAQIIAEADQKQKRLNQDFVNKKNEAQTLKKQLVKVKNAMERGKDLLEKLEGQKERWEKDSDKLTVDVDLLPKSTAITAAFVTYLSASPENIRHNKIEEWKKVFKCHYYQFLNFVTNQAISLQEVSLGLPNDQLSIENSQILALNKPVPLIIDPHTQATNWLKGKLGKQGTVQTLTQQDPKFMNTLQLSVRFGKILILQQIDYIEPIVTSIIKNDYIQQGPRLLLQIGQKVVDVNETFRLYMATRNSMIDIPHHQADLVSIVNFSVTRSGLEGKLLSLIISHFQPELEKQKQKLLENQEKLKINLSDLEERLLKQLADSSGNILENEKLIKSLNQTKQQSHIVTNTLKQSETLQLQIDQKRQIFMPISQMGAKLYISLSVLKKLNPMYKYNLSQFIGLFEESLEVGGGSSHQINEIKHQLIKIIYDNISISLLKNHRLLLGIIIIKQVMDGVILDAQFDALVGNMVPSPTNNLPNWVEDKDKQLFANFQSILSNQVNFNNQKWAKWSKMTDCETNIPQQANLTPFQETLLVSACRQDRLMNSFNHFVTNTLQIQNLSGMAINMKVITQKKMSQKIPCLFIVSVGFDPSKQIQQHAAKTVGKQKFQQLSMGGDQNNYALQLLRDSAQQGKWLCLKNLHLVINFVIILEKQLLSLDPHRNFRLFLTTQARENFPPILLETCYKVSYQAPPGLKMNFARMVNSQNFSDNHPLDMVLTFFHALIQERRNYIPQGWTKSYQFNYGDYKSGLVLMNQLKKNNQINWPMLQGLMLDTIYGGRIDNEIDLRILQTSIKKYFNEKTIKGNEQLAPNLTSKNIANFQQILSETDNPVLYGLPNAIEKAVMKLQSKEALENLKIVSTGIIQNTKFSRDIWQKNLASTFTLWKGLRKNIQHGGIKKIDEKDIKSVDPIDSFVFNEASEAKKNFQLIKHHFEALEKVLFGNEILTSQIEEIGQILLKGEVPNKWRKIWEGPDIVTQWLKIFSKKLESTQKWVEMAQKKQIIGKQVDLAEVFRPQIFFNALKQKAARQRKIPVDKLHIKCSFSSSSSGEIAVQLKNLVVEGCSISGNTIADAKPHQQYEQILTFYMFYNEEGNKADDYLIPFYTDNTRTVLLSTLPVRVTGEHSTKIIAGAAIMLRS